MRPTRQQVTVENAVNLGNIPGARTNSPAMKGFVRKNELPRQIRHKLSVVKPGKTNASKPVTRSQAARTGAAVDTNKAPWEQDFAPKVLPEVQALNAMLDDASGQREMKQGVRAMHDKYAMQVDKQFKSNPRSEGGRNLRQPKSRGTTFSSRINPTKAGRN
ncbi:unnamed protein product [Pedinophyceae sp. YPF-701]|nr:unnamed protein product [Pedinophyceae sp. YPF-701]